MWADKDFLRNVSFQTEPGREELKALKDCTGPSPGFMEQQELLLQDLPCPTSLCPLNPGAWDLWRTLASSRRKDAEEKGNKRKKTQRVVGWAQGYLSASHQWGLHLWTQRRPDRYTTTFPLKDILPGTAKEKWESVKDLVKRKNDRGAPLLFGKSD